jgi:molybdopterin/thiamine biosynthesis adenylyltransferase/rhodanese-related sulfurtransferase
MSFTPRELSRYARQFSIPEFGMEGQSRLRCGSVLCIGAGGLGSPALTYLAAAGVGRIGIVDADRVDASNLHRQLLYTLEDVGRLKAEAAQERLRSVNPDVTVEIYPERFTSANAADFVSRFDIVLDGSDNFATRYLSSDTAVWQRKPNIYGSILRFEGQATLFAPHLGGPCYRCFLPTPPAPGMVPTCAESGVLGILPGIIGLIQATEAVKFLTGLGDSLTGRLVHFDALAMRFREFKLRRDPACCVCGESPTLTQPIDYDSFCGAADSCAMKSTAPAEMTVQELALLLQNPASDFLLIDVREPWELDIAKLPNTLAIPLGEIGNRLSEIPVDKDIAIHCKAGGRSAKAVDILRASGFQKVRNVTGGINAWSKEIDPSVAWY